MSSFQQYCAQVAALPVDEFIHRHPHAFLLKRAEADGPADHKVAVGYESEEGPTSTTSAATIRAMLASLDAARSTDEWMVVPLAPRARAGSPNATVTFIRGTGLKHSAGFARLPPLVIGRSHNCDIVLPYASISKTHAHILVGPDHGVSVIDQASRNGTYVDERRLAPGERARLKPGASLRLGNLSFAFVNARGLYEALLARGTN